MIQRERALSSDFEPKASPAKIAIIGAGSADFTWKLADQLFAHPTLAHLEIALCDIDPERLSVAKSRVETVVFKHQATPKISATLDRREAIKGSLAVINIIRVGGYPATEKDFQIPEKYGLGQTVGDTVGIGAIMLSARTLPVVRDILHDMEELSPDGLFLNHTNPLAGIVLGAYHFSPQMKIYGLCHSVDETALQLAGFLNKPVDELEYETAGFNHMAFFLKLKHKGRDMYPSLFKAMQDEKIWEQDKVRFEIMSLFGYFPSESSTHWAEYVPYFLHPDRVEIIAKYGIEPNYYLRRLQELNERWQEMQKNPELVIDEHQTREYDPLILDSLLTGNRHQAVITVLNAKKYIPNLPENSAVEVSCQFNQHGISPQHTSALPTQLLGLIDQHIIIQQLVAEAMKREDPDPLIHAAYLDSRVSSILHIDQVSKMMRELFDAHEPYLPKKFFKKSLVFTRQVRELELHKALQKLVDPFTQSLMGMAYWRNRAGYDWEDKDTDDSPDYPTSQKVLNFVRSLFPNDPAVRANNQMEIGNLFKNNPLVHVIRELQPTDETKRVSQWLEQEGEKFYWYALRFDKNPDGIFLKNARTAIIVPDWYKMTETAILADLNIKFVQNNMSEVRFAWHDYPFPIHPENIYPHGYIHELVQKNPLIGGLIKKTRDLRQLPPEAAARFVLGDQPKLIFESPYNNLGGWLIRRSTRFGPSIPYYVFKFDGKQFTEESDQPDWRNKDHISKDQFIAYLRGVLSFMQFEGAAVIVDS